MISHGNLKKSKGFFCQSLFNFQGAPHARALRRPTCSTIISHHSTFVKSLFSSFFILLSTRPRVSLSGTTSCFSCAFPPQFAAQIFSRLRCSARKNCRVFRDPAHLRRSNVDSASNGNGKRSLASFRVRSAWESVPAESMYPRNVH